MCAFTFYNGTEKGNVAVPVPADFQIVNAVEDLVQELLPIGDSGLAHYL